MLPSAVQEWLAPTLAARIGELGGTDQSEIVHKLKAVIDPRS